MAWWLVIQECQLLSQIFDAPTFTVGKGQNSKGLVKILIFNNFLQINDIFIELFNCISVFAKYFSFSIQEVNYKHPVDKLIKTFII